MKFYLLSLTLFSMVLIIIFAAIFYIWFLRLMDNRSLEYFNSLSFRSEQNVHTYLEEVSRLAHMVSYSGTVQDFLFRFRDDAYGRISSRGAVVDLLARLMIAFSDISEIAFYTQEGFLFSTGLGYTHMIRNAIINNEVMPGFHFSEPFFSGVLFNTTDLLDPHSPYVLFVYPIYSLIHGDFRSYNQGMALILIRVDDLIKRYMIGHTEDEVHVALFNRGELLLSSSYLLSNNQGFANDLNVGISYFTYQGENFFSHKYLIANTEFSIIAALSTFNLNRDIYPLINTIRIFVALSVSLMLIFVLICIRSISKPIDRLLENINSIDVGNSSHEIPHSKVKEVSMIATSINAMMSKIELMTQEQQSSHEALYEASILIKQAQLQYYRSQINPHFLYNTLECIRAMAQTYNAECIQSIAISMARMFRYSVSDTTEVILGDEFSNATDYFNIISQRSPGNYHLILRISDDAANVMVQKMILQPLIENAVTHGFDGKDPPHNIFLRAHLVHKNMLEITVVDNGFGIPDGQVELLNKKMALWKCEKSTEHDLSIGLFNINKRLHLVYGETCSMVVTSKLGHYTCAQIRIPCNRR